MEWFGNRRKMLTHYRRVWGKLTGMRVATATSQALPWLAEIPLKEVKIT